MRRNLAFRPIVGSQNDQGILKFTDLLQFVIKLSKHVIHVHHVVAVNRPGHGLSSPFVRGIIVEVATASCVIQKERLFAALHLVQKVQADLQPVRIQVLDVGQVDQPPVLAICLISRGAVDLRVAEVVFLHHLETSRRK